MSLDITLFSEAKLEKAPTTGVWIREDGQRRELSEAEVLERWPNWEPQLIESEPSSEVFSYNITHNLGQMAEAAGIYQHLWRPEELGITKAKGLIEPLTTGLDLLRSDPSKFKALNPSNGWGTYDGLVRFVDHYLDACKAHPDATISADQ